MTTSSIPPHSSLDWFKKSFPGQDIFEYHWRLAEARKPQHVEMTWAPGSMEWLAEREKSNGPAAVSPAPPSLTGQP